MLCSVNPGVKTRARARAPTCCALTCAVWVPLVSARAATDTRSPTNIDELLSAYCTKIAPSTADHDRNQAAQNMNVSPRRPPPSTLPTGQLVLRGLVVLHGRRRGPLPFSSVCRALNSVSRPHCFQYIHVRRTSAAICFATATGVLRLVPCTLRSAPSILRLAPSALHPPLCILRPAACALQPMPCSLASA